MFQGLLLELRWQPLLLYPKLSHPFPFYRADKRVNFKRFGPPGGRVSPVSYGELYLRMEFI